MIKTAASVLLVLQSSQAFSPQSKLLVHHVQQHGTFMKRYLLHSSSSSNSSGNSSSSSSSRIDVSNTPLDQTESSTYASTNPLETDSTSASWPSTTTTAAATATATSLPSSQQDDSLMSLNGNAEEELSNLLQQTNTSIDASLLPTNSSVENLAEEIIAKEKRVHVTIKFSNIPGLRPYFLTIANKIKSLNPDVIVEKQVMPTAEDDVLEETVFEVLVDGKVVIGKSSSNFQPVRRSGKEEVNKNKVYGMSVYVSMGDVNAAIGKARKKRRPSTSYLPEDREKAIRLEMLRGNDDK